VRNAEEYMPTWDELVNCHEEITYLNLVANLKSEEERWLVEHDAAVQEEEREAIAAYLESDRWCNEGVGVDAWETSQVAAQAVRWGWHRKERP